MTPVQELIKTIDKSVNKFNDGIPAIQKQMLSEIELLLKKLDLKGNNIQASAKNLRIIGEIKNKIDRIIKSPEYKELVKEFTKTFPEVSKLQNEYFRSLSKEFKPNKLLAELQVQSVSATLDRLFQAGVSTNIGSKIVEILRQNITGGGKYMDMVERLREYLMTTKAGNGALEQYAKQIITDALNQYSRQYLNIVSNDLGLEWFRYTGSEIETSRPFCKAMVHKEFFHVSEIPDLLAGNFPEFKKEDGVINPKTDLPSGFIPGTNEQNFMIYAAGFQCRHQIIPIPETNVPKRLVKKIK